jgi:SAM-dependent methyltransferase
LRDNPLVTTRGLGGTDSTWERLAQNDPIWASLCDPAKRGRGWDRDEFFATGEQEIAELMAYLGGIAPGLARSRALDFGCGIGRLTRPLAEHFARVTGMDVSPTMIDAARENEAKKSPQSGVLEYLVNAGTQLPGEDGTYDLVYSSITLQHIPKAAALRYLKEFVRVLKPGGIAVFQLPARRRPSLKTRIGTILPGAVRAKRYSGIEMHGVPRGDVLSALAMAGGEVIDVQRDHLAGPEWESFRYAITRG